MLDNFSLNEFLSFQNPLIYILSVGLFIFIVIYISFKDIYRPLLKKQKLERLNLERRNKEISNRLILVDPNPIIRIDDKSNILLYKSRSTERLYNFFYCEL
ncbi:MAG: hypothetical protein JEY94_00030 [Melioribacteraceae bacterium]|nr:hypothetical protein [Melioribacteraceae bacterium]